MDENYFNLVPHQRHRSDAFHESLCCLPRSPLLSPDPRRHHHQSIGTDAIRSTLNDTHGADPVDSQAQSSYAFINNKKPFFNHSNMHLVQRFTSRFILSPLPPIIRHDKFWPTQKDSHHLVQTKVSGSFKFVYLVVRGRLFEVQSGATGCSTGGTN